MKKRLNDKQFGWCKSWKSLLIVTNLFSFAISLIHFLSKISYIPDSTSNGKLAVLIALCHFYPIFVFRVYYENFNILVKENKISKTSKLFWGGALFIFLWEIVNILVLIFL